MCTVVVALMALTTNKFILAALSNLGILSAFLLSIASLFVIYQREGARAKLMVPILGFFSWACLMYYSAQLGTTLQEKLITLLPFVLVAIGGIIMYSIKTRRKVTA